MVICRSESRLSDEIRRKIALFASLPVEAVISANDVDNIYKVPLNFDQERVDDFVLTHLGLDAPPPKLDDWKALNRRADQSSKQIQIGIVGKYVRLQDAYLSVSEALYHSGFTNGCRIKIHWIDSEQLIREDARAALEELDGILVPGGFGDRGIEGMISAAQVARESQIPYLGICLGMHIAVSEFARNVADMDGANSVEFDPETPYPVIDLLPEQKEVTNLGGTMRLGADPVKLHEQTRVRSIYGETVVYERHRHRYEVNNLLRKRLQAHGLVFSGTSPDERLVEIIELEDHPFFIASQFHAEFKSRPERPAPLFAAFVKAALERAQKCGRSEITDEVKTKSAGRFSG